MSRNSQTKMNTFTKELGNLLSLKIDSYHKKYCKGIEFLFLNAFIHCPYEGESCYDSNRSAARTRQHFEEHLDIGLFDIALNCISITKSKEIEYSFYCNKDFIEKDNEDILEFTVINQKINIEDVDSFSYLRSIDNEVLDKLILKIKNLISIEAKKH
jgi:hypothetical protein